MTRTALMMTAATLIGLTVLANSRGHSQTAPGSAAQAVAEQNLLDMKALAEHGDRLTVEAEAMSKEFDAKQKKLEDTAANAGMARQNVDDMIKLLRAVTDRLGPNGAYVKILKQQQEFARNMAADAMAEKDTGALVFADKLTSQDTQIGSMREEAADLAARLTAQIDLLERKKSLIVYAYAVTRTDEFIATARAYLEGARTLLKSVIELGARRDGLVAQTVPSQ